MSISKIIFPLFLFFYFSANAQIALQVLTEKNGVSLRGLSLPSKDVIWASGSKGSVVKSEDGGKTFNWMQVRGFEQRDFRAIHAFDAQTAIIVAVAAPAVILKTKDGGQNWKLVTEIIDSNMFLDAIDFKDPSNGWVIGDPIDQQIFMLHTKDSGDSWQEVGVEYFTSKVIDGEAFFAASNSNMAHTNEALFMVTGGMASRLWINGTPTEIPIIQGSKTKGANSIAFSPDEKRMLIVGGDFANDSVSENNILCLELKLAADSSTKQWTKLKVKKPPFGYKSCVHFMDQNWVLSCGTSGLDISHTGGINWQRISKYSFHVLKKVPEINNAIVAGVGGRIALIHLP